MHVAAGCRGEDCTWYVRGDGQTLAVTCDDAGNVTYVRLVPKAVA